MNSGFIILHVLGVSLPNDIHINPDQIVCFVPITTGTNIMFTNPAIQPVLVRESPEEIDRLLGRLHTLVEGIPN